MRKLLLLGLALSLLSGCDRTTGPGERMFYITDYTWINESTHMVTLSMPEIDLGQPGFEAVIAPGKSYTSGIGSIKGSSGIPPGNYGLWKMTVTFDCGAYSVLYDAALHVRPPGEVVYPEHYDFRYDPTLARNYEYKIDDRGGKTQLTYWFTDGDFAAAKARAE